MSLAALPGGKIVGGSTTSPGTGGEIKAKEAELYIMDMATHALEWHEALFPGAQEYTDLCVTPAGLVLGVVDRKRFFAFDPAQRKVVHDRKLEGKFGPTTSQQGPRVFVLDPDQRIFMLFVKGIASVDPATFDITWLANSPIPIGPGGDILDGRIYFASGSHLYSYSSSKPKASVV